MKLNVRFPRVSHPCSLSEARGRLADATGKGPLPRMSCVAAE